MQLTTDLGEDFSTTMTLNSDILILMEISIWDMSGNLLWQQELAEFVDKNAFRVHLPKINKNVDLLLCISTSCGNYSQLINIKKQPYEHFN